MVDRVNCNTDDRFFWATSRLELFQIIGAELDLCVIFFLSGYH